MRRFLIGFAALALVAGACGDDSETTTGSGGDGLGGRTFLSTESTHALVDGTQVRLQFGDDGPLSATAGCNHLLGEVTSTDDGVLDVGPMGGTEMGCDPDRHAQDEWLMAFLGSSPAWSLDGDTLTLTGETDTLVLVDRMVADPDRPLEGTTWNVDGIIDGDSVSSVPGAAAAWLTIAEGRISGDAGCNTFSGPVVIRDGELEVRGVEATLKGCDDERGELEASVFAVVRSGQVRYEIEAARLTLTGDDGRGLVLVAAEP